MKRLVSVFLQSAIFTALGFSQGIDNDNFVVNHGPWIQNLGTSGVTIIWTTNKPAVPGITLTFPDGTTKFIQEQP